MFLEYIGAIVVMLIANLFLSVITIIKLKKLEKFQTNEAHGNLELINQSLNRLSDITEALEHIETTAEDTTDKPFTSAQYRTNQSREQRALTMIRQGEDPRKIGRLLGISKSELELLTASEKLGNSHQYLKAKIGS